MADIIPTTNTLAVNIDAIASLIEEMNTELDKVKHTAELFDMDAETMTATATEDLKNAKTCLSVAVREAKAAKTSFRKEWQKPMNEVCSLFDDELNQADTQLATLKQEVNKREQMRKSKQIKLLEGAYTEFCENNGYSELPKNLPFARLFEPSWLNGGKGWRALKAAELVTQKAQKIIADLSALDAAGLHDVDSAKLYYFQTLDLGTTLKHDKAKAESQKQLQALKAEQAENRAFRNNTEVSKYTFTIECTEEEAQAIEQQLQQQGFNVTNKKEVSNGSN